MANKVIPHSINDWSPIDENEGFWGKINLLNPNQNFGIHEYNGKLWSSGLVGVGHLFDINGNPIFENGEEHILVVTSRYGLSPWRMLEKVMEDDEYDDYMEELHRQNKYLYQIFHDQPLIALPREANSKEELLYAISYINSCFSLCKKGLKKSIVYKSENYTAKLRGEIDITKNVKYNTARGRSDKFYCKYLDFTEDNIENRIVKACLLKCKKILLNKSLDIPKMNEKSMYCLNTLRHVKNKKITMSDFSEASVTGLYSYYKPVLQQARAILGCQSNSYSESLSTSNKKTYTIPFVINMETLFEFYVRTILKKSLNSNEYMLDKYSERIYLQADVNRGSNAEKGIHLMQYCIPDVIICRKDSKKPVMVIDAKYKPDDKPVREDSHQLLSYVLLTGVKRCGFVFPGKTTIIKNMESTKNNYLLLKADGVRYYEIILGSNNDVETIVNFIENTI